MHIAQSAGLNAAPARDPARSEPGVHIGAAAVQAPATTDRADLERGLPGDPSRHSRQANRVAPGRSGRRGRPEWRIVWNQNLEEAIGSHVF